MSMGWPWWESYKSVQIVATSHDLGPQKVAKEVKSAKVSGKSSLVKYYKLVISGL